MTCNQLDFLATKKELSLPLSTAVDTLHKSGMVLLLDDDRRENEGDLVVAGEKITPQLMNFLIKKGSGVVCLAMSRARLKKLNIGMMGFENNNMFRTPFTISIEAVSGVSTGVSAQDRAHTIKVAMADDAKPEDLARPGHVFPLAAQDLGVFARMGHTEGSVDLMKIAGLKEGAVLCELMNEDGSMTLGKARLDFAKKHDIPVLFVEDILFHRIKTENIVKKLTSKTLNTDFGQLCWHQFEILGQVADIFTTSDFDENLPAHLIKLEASNLRNRFLNKVLAANNDDGLSLGLKMLSAQKQGVLCLIDCSLAEKRTLALISRLLRELNIKTIVKELLQDSFIELAQNHFDITIK